MNQQQALKRLIELSPEIDRLYNDQDRRILALCYLHGRQDAIHNTQIMNEDSDTPAAGLGAETPGADPYQDGYNNGYHDGFQTAETAARSIVEADERYKGSETKPDTSLRGNSSGAALSPLDTIAETLSCIPGSGYEFLNR